MTDDAGSEVSVRAPEGSATAPEAGGATTLRWTARPGRRWAGDRFIWAWVLTRLLMLAICFSPGYPLRSTISDVVLYHEWGPALAEGRFPGDDARWQYPPLAVLPLLLPRVLGGQYGITFMLCALAADLAILCLLRSKDRAPAGAWCWITGIFLLGPICLFRFDLFVTIPVVAALLWPGRHRLFGVLMAVGALMKAWPVALAFALRRDRTAVRVAVACAATGALVAGAVTIAGDGVWSFLRAQRDRGAEIEAVAATPINVARLFGWTGEVRYQYGSWELVGPGVGAAVAASLVITVVGLVLLAVPVLRRDPREWTPAAGADAVLAGVLVLVVGGRVLSPQYLIWVLGVAAACLATAGSRQRLPAAMVLAAAALTHLGYPILWRLLNEGRFLPNAVLTLRNALLVAAAVLAVRAVWRRPRKDTPRQGAAAVRR
ncbi:membrane protein [Actinomadura sp. NBRC 104425]|uniref:glycosyltransferase 87 family protein n=1 Tax=Actinomadura sp. NBRC 104425 TaxID=3032204 RepID=UPI00249FFD1F|nr:glycosyltransferase 87 family protein [Actinomadura sp. NBRC 104425]GLZ09939.1 membrane protein [Actinomadura sp. NBRC 104425]